MVIKADQFTSFVFDLDDTLYDEIDYLKSAYRQIANEISAKENDYIYHEMLKIYLSGGNAFEFILKKFSGHNLTLEKLLYLYRNHNPDISVRDGVFELLSKIKSRGGVTGIITDGRGITQRNKVKALGISDMIDIIVISEEFGSEKPSSSLFESFMGKDSGRRYYYFGDNLIKDFVSPKRLGWSCIGILNQNNIRKQNLTEFSDEYLPHVFINSFTDIGII